MFRRWHRVAAISILLWAVVDMSVPSLCEADGGFIPSSSPQHASVSVDGDKNSQPTPVQEDDCFCCCAHISPTRHFEFAAVGLSEQFVPVTPEQRLLEFAESHYHPPRA